MNQVEPAVIYNEIVHMKNSLELIEKSINGNGRKGLLDRVMALEVRFWIVCIIIIGATGINLWTR